MIHSDISQKGSVSKKKITLIKGPARHKQISAGYEHNLPAVVSRAPNTSSFM
jgi:hypothetical protein